MGQGLQAGSWRLTAISAVGLQLRFDPCVMTDRRPGMPAFSV